MSIIDQVFFLAPHLADKAQVSGVNAMVCCPYHKGGNENTPSMSISLVDPVYFCHGCKKGGTVKSLLVDLGASESMADQALSRSGMSGRREARKVQDRGVDAPIAVRIPTVDEDEVEEEGVAYILDEGILDEYRLAPKALMRDGFEKSTLRFFGIGVDKDQARITFPIRDFEGNLLGVSGRTYVGMEPRYKIYKTELTRRRKWGIPRNYSLESAKSRLLWNGHNAKKLINNGHTLVLTEGFKAAMWVWQAGHQCVAATIGSYLTKNHAEWIYKHAGRVIIFYDADEAGVEGTRKAIDTLVNHGVSVKIAKYPENTEATQPDGLTSSQIAEALIESQNFIEWKTAQGSRK